VSDNCAGCGLPLDLAVWHNGAAFHERCLPSTWPAVNYDGWRQGGFDSRTGPSSDRGAAAISGQRRTIRTRYDGSKSHTFD
jgi:hypothetical protein